MTCTHCDAIEQRGRFCVGCGKRLPPSLLPSRRARLAPAYLRDDDTGAFWSPSWQPTQTELDWYECRHGLGYTTIASRHSASL